MEFVLGGWCMNDDADPTFPAMIEQMTRGHEFIYSTFGSQYLPKYGWAIDPFGLSSGVARAWAEFGFKGHVINRVDYRLKEDLKNSQNLEFIWRPDPALGSSSDILTHILDSHYSFPSGFDFEKDTPITDANIKSRASILVSELKKRASWFKTRNILIPGGDDFRWIHADTQFTNWDKLIKEINSNPGYGVHIKYATLSEYFDAVQSSEAEWSVYEGDFFPYADGEHAYWTGFYTTHPTLKHLLRQSEWTLRSLEGLAVAARVLNGTSADADAFRAIALPVAQTQHHDGVTGTSKEPVIEMYRSDLQQGLSAGDELGQSLVSTLTGAKAQDIGTVHPDESLALPLLAHREILITNSLAWEMNDIVKVELDASEFVCSSSDASQLCGSVRVRDSEGREVPAQLSAYHTVSTAPAPASPASGWTLVLYMRVTVPPVGLVVLDLHHTADGAPAMPVPAPLSDTLTITNSHTTIDVSGHDLTVTCVKPEACGTTPTTLSLNFYEYNSYIGDGQQSGAYIFRPAGPAHVISDGARARQARGGSSTSSATSSASSGETTRWTVTGSLVTDVVYTPDAKHVYFLRLFNDPFENADIEIGLEVETVVGPLDKGKETVLRVATDLNTAELFTDNNGVLMKRRRDPRDADPIASKYYPFVSQAYLQETGTDAPRQVTVLTSFTHGIGHLKDNMVEIMVHRRCIHDDGRGMGESLDDESVARSLFSLVVGDRGKLEGSRGYLSTRFSGHAFPVMFSGMQPGALPLRTLSAVPWPMPRTVHAMQLRPHYLHTSHIVVSWQHLTADASITAPTNGWLGKGQISGEEMVVSGLRAKGADSQGPAAVIHNVWSWVKAGVSSILPALSDISLQPLEIKTFVMKSM
eukprot:TRINITY_DN1678_c0_g1::TRINITY_DN1678_c0_g1_i1::g.17727::m.17727 TRINITY_DN1678_c0_g1::TRINITY_DN1678_c0_g1_i1::g.17727  ORF type:complete len:991 (-),score=264.01,sp/P34098/MANA_DICDI/29.95/6e-112,Glyco_hydro_38/PF01074.17/3.4e-76,Glyco_hydro_38C/PF07748.8/1e-27,Alpha-mann_mid/PF09261.6/2.7e-16 TRINITY_DN1678_c0_g1_i1:104-2710(-)